MSESGPGSLPGPATGAGAGDALRLHRWSDPAVIAIALVALASGFGQFGVVAALGDVSKELGHAAAGSSIADKVGLSGTSLGIGLAIIRLASLGSLPLIGIADRWGRRRVILAVTVAGLACTVAAAASPGYWWFVVIFAFGRPLLSATNALAEVMAAEETSSRDRSSAIALVAAGYGVGAGISAIVHSLDSALGFRGIFALAAVPLILVLFLRRRIEEPNRFIVAELQVDRPTPILGAVGRRYRGRVALLALIAFVTSIISGPANSFVFLYAQDVLHLAGYLTALMVVGAGVTGLGGLLVGRWLADHVGRRPTCTVGLVAVALSATLSYSGSSVALVAGYVVGVFCAAVFAPAIGSLLTELFPTSIRASVTGWWTVAGVLGAVAGLVVFGAVADVGDRFALAADIVFLPCILAAALFWAVPETRGREPESLWPESSQV